MRRFLIVLFLSTFGASAQVSFQLDPGVITRCDPNNLGQTRVIWTNAGTSPVFVHVFSPAGPPLTGPMPSSGQADTLTWVTDGMAFVLTDSGGRELARATAAVRCTSDASGTFFPLAVGDTWVYQVISRGGGPYYSVQRVKRAQLDAAGVLWFVIGDGSAETLYRIDDQGRVHTTAGTGADQIYLDPAKGPAELTVTGIVGDSLAYTGIFGNLLRESGTFVRGLGRTASSSTSLTGSSGGFVIRYDLIYARIGDRTFSKAQPAFELSAESTDLDVSGMHVSNCALPCYFVACGVAFPQPDPPGTYKPCFGARIHVSGSFPNASVTFSLLDPSDTVLETATLPVPYGFEVQESAFAAQLKLYSAPNVPLPPGKYKLRGVLMVDGAEQASSVMSLGVR